MEKENSDKHTIKTGSTGNTTASNANSITNKLTSSKVKELFNRAFYLITKNENDGSKDYYSSIINDLTYGRRFIFCSDTQAYLKAVNIFSEVIQFNPSFPFSYLYRGIATINSIGSKPTPDEYLLLNRVEPDKLIKTGIKAFKNYRIFLDFMPTNADGYYHFGEAVSLFKGNMATLPKVKALATFEKAIDYFDKAIQLDPDFRNAYWSRAKQSSGESSVKDYSKAIELTTSKSKLTYLYTGRARALKGMERYQKAIRDCSNAIKVNPYASSGFFVCFER